jgi:hypothetical protein
MRAVLLASATVDCAHGAERQPRRRLAGCGCTCHRACWSGQAFLAATRILPWRHPQPGGKLATRSKQGRIGNGRGNRAGAHGADTQYGHQQTTDPALPMPPGQAPLDLPDPLYRVIQLVNIRLQDRARELREQLLLMSDCLRQDLGSCGSSTGWRGR